jgi:hypothetical protein
MGGEVPVGPSARDWANASLQVTKVEHPEQGTMFELRKELVIHGVRHLQFIWLNQLQLRSVGIDHGL